MSSSYESLLPRSLIQGIMFCPDHIFVGVLVYHLVFSLWLLFGLGYIYMIFISVIVFTYGFGSGDPPGTPLRCIKKQF